MNAESEVPGTEKKEAEKPREGRDEDFFRGSFRAPSFLMHVLSLAFFANAGFEVPLVDFKGSDPKLTHTWKPNNDPVMGGQSYSTVVVQNEVLNFTGKCAIVPSLQAPGFITAVNSDKAPWVDVSGCEGLKITSKSTIPYSGFRISFGNAHPIGGKFFATRPTSTRR